MNLENLKNVTSYLLSDPYLQPFWDNVLEKTTKNTMIWYVFGINFWATFIYWTHGLVYVYMDVCKKPAWTQKYKIRRKEDKPLDWKTFKDIAAVVLYNNFVVQLTSSSVLYYIWCYFEPIDPVFKRAPTFLKFIIDFLVMLLFREITFYYLHRLLHYGKMYVYFHKKHHTWTAPIAISSAYCTPVEHIMTNTIPTIVGYVIMQSSYITVIIWYYFLMASSVHKHSGYDFPWYYPTTKSHEAHHQTFNTNYGLYDLMDWIHGTLYKEPEKKDK